MQTGLSFGSSSSKSSTSSKSVQSDKIVSASLAVSNPSDLGNDNDSDFDKKLNKKVNNSKKNTSIKDYSQVSDFKYSNTIIKHIPNRSYMNSRQLINEIVNSSTPIKDRSLSNGLKWSTNGSINGTEGIWELVVDMKSKTIVHYLFKGF